MKKRIVRKAVFAVNTKDEILVKAEERNSQMAAAIEEGNKMVNEMNEKISSTVARTMACEHNVFPQKKEKDMNDRLKLIKERHQLMEEGPTIEEIEEQEEFLATLKEDVDEGLEEVDVKSLIGDFGSEGVKEVCILTQLRPREETPMTEGLREQMLRLNLDPDTAINGDDACRMIRWAEEDKEANASLLKSFCNAMKDAPHLYEEILGKKLPSDTNERNSFLNDCCRDGWDEQHLDEGFKKDMTHSVGEY